MQQPGHHPEEGRSLTEAGTIPHIEASTCRSCGKSLIPPRERCPYCRGKMEKVAVDGAGEVLSWTTVHVVPEGFSPPLTVALVQLDCGARVLCSMTGVPEPRMGAPVLVFLENGSFRAK